MSANTTCSGPINAAAENAGYMTTSATLIRFSDGAFLLLWYIVHRDTLKLFWTELLKLMAGRLVFLSFSKQIIGTY